MPEFNVDALIPLFEHTATVMADKAGELCELDALMGDGDLGLTMSKGFGAMPEILVQLDEPDMGKKLTKAGLKMASVVPSTMGTLMATGFMSGGKILIGTEILQAADYLRFLRGFSEGIIKRGKCARGDKTVLDAVAAAADTLENALKNEPAMTLSAAGAYALVGATEGVEATKSMEPRFGKAAVHRAVTGKPDQGACAAKYMLEAFSEFFSEIM